MRNIDIKETAAAYSAPPRQFAMAVSSNRRAKIVHFSSVHPPYDIRVFHKECKTLANSGYEVVFVVPCQSDAVSDGIRIRSVAPATSRPQRMFRVVWQVYRAAVSEHGDLYHFHDPELLPIAVLLKLRGKRVVYDVHENVAEDILDKPYIASWLRKPLAWSIGAVETLCAKACAGIVCATPAIARQFRQDKTVVVQNFPTFVEAAGATSQNYADRPMIAAYTGGITLIRGIKEMLEAMSRLPETLPARLVMAAKFDPPDLEQEMRKSAGWDRVDFVGWKSMQDVTQILGRSRMGLVLYHPLANHVEAQPHKLFEYMSAGIPIIASDFPLWRRIIEESRCGIVVDPMDPNRIAEAIQWVFEHPEEAKAMGERGQRAAATLYNWDHEAETLLHLYRELLPPIRSERSEPTA
jgi:glycosyltransferase involved in cell wall biosynthesis